ncbi:MAG: hypothetical protein GF344_03510 [Chitinivibrionales bacterium]|nr:hypothetical protein [Chitinivibrionales bacterium]MBD3356138.1 hypothetical protein [Chitinivibrionales bacterium]
MSAWRREWIACSIWKTGGLLGEAERKRRGEKYMHECDECGNKPANIHLTQIINNETTIFRLCEECARKKGISISIGVPQVSLQPQEQNSRQDAAADDAVVCPNCDLTLAEFKENGWLGCSSCYQAFADDINNLLLRVHSAHVHRGKQYRCAPAGMLDDKELKRLRKEMELAIRSEKFELAAAIRDKINDATVQSSCGGPGES